MPMTLRASRCYFNPRTREGCDTQAHRVTKYRSGFQSTHPRGVRPEYRAAGKPKKEFQSTHPRGVRRVRANDGAHLHDFNPRTREGCDRRRLVRCAVRNYFNPRTREGCDCGFIQKNKRFSDIPLFFLLRRRSGRTLGAKTDVQAAYSAHACQAARPTNRRSGAQPPENARSSPRFRCEPLCDLMNASPSHYRMSGSSGRYACLQPKCSILLSYFFPR